MYTPFSRSGNKKLGLILGGLGVLLIPDAILPTFTDLILNVPIAMVIATLTGMSFLNALIATFMLGFILVLAGLSVYPYNTTRLLKGRLKAGLSLMLHNPILLVIGVISLFVVYLFGQMAYDYITQSAVILAGM